MASFSSSIVLGLFVYTLDLRYPPPQKKEGRKSIDIAGTGYHMLGEHASNNFQRYSRRVSCGTVLLEPHFSHVYPTLSEFWTQEVVEPFGAGISF